MICWRGQQIQPIVDHQPVQSNVGRDTGCGQCGQVFGQHAQAQAAAQHLRGVGAQIALVDHVHLVAQSELDLVLSPCGGLFGADLQGQGFFGCSGFSQGGRQLQTQTAELAAHRQLGQALGPCQAGVVVGGAAGVLSQQVQRSHIVCRLQARSAHAASGFKYRLGGLGGRLACNRVGGVHAAIDQGGPAQQRGLQLAHLKTALVELQRAIKLVQPRCAGQHAQVVAIELHTALYAGVVQVQQGQLQGKAGEHGATGLGGLQRPREQLVQRGLPHHAQHQGGIGQALGLYTQHRLVGHVGDVD